MSAGRTSGGWEKTVTSRDSNKKKDSRSAALQRLGDASFAPAAVIGALTSFAGAAFGFKGEAAEKKQQNASLVQIGFSEPEAQASAPRMDRKYAQVLVLGAADSGQPFRRSISGVAVDAADRIYVLGDGEVRVCDSNGNFLRGWKAAEGAQCMAVGADGRVYLGGAGRVEIYSGAGVREKGFAAGESGKRASLTAIKIVGGDILVADASARFIRRYTEGGKQIGEIGTQNKTRGFMLPNRFLDMDVDDNGVVRATDSGRHRVSSWNLDGTAAGHFGRFGLKNPEDFVGCCNPVNIAAAPGGNIVTAEKVVARIKVFDAAGKLLGLIGPENFDPQCTHLYLAVDSGGRIIVGDPVRLEVKVFSAKKYSGGSEKA